jgi:DNA-binding transcriptional ArsR family regulator
MNDEAVMNQSVPESDVGPEPLPDRRIADVETIKALSDPLRLRILEVMTSRPDETFTVKRLARDLDVGATKLYHHINLLAERELIRPAGTRVVSGIIETSYRIGQLTISLDRSLLGADSPELHDVLTTVFESARDDIERGLRSGAIDPSADAEAHRKLTLAKGIARVPKDRIAELQARLKTLFDEFESDPETDGDPYGLLFSLYPMTDIETEGAER